MKEHGKKKKSNKNRVKSTQSENKSQRQTKSNSRARKSDHRSWLAKALRCIEDRVAQQSSALLENYRKQMSVSEKKSKHENTSRSLELLKAEENSIREKLREIRKLQREAKPAKKLTDFKPTVKSNKQLRELTKKFREFNDSLIEKSKLIEAEQEKHKQKQAELIEEHRKTECEERRKKIEQTLQKMAVRRKDRLDEHRKERMRLKQLQKQKLYEKMKQDFDKKMNDIDAEKMLKYQRQKQLFTVEMSELSEHEKQYEANRFEKEEKRTVRLAESRLLPQVNHYRSRFYDSVLERDAEEKERQTLAKEKAKQLAEKHKKYQQYVTAEFAPKLMQPSSDESDTEESEEKENKKVVPLEYRQMIEKGNEYLKEAQKYIVSAEREKQLQKIREIQLEMQNERKVYPNYLAEISNSRSNTHKKSPNNIYDGELSRIKTIIESKSMKSVNKVEEVKTSFQKLSLFRQPIKEQLDDQLISQMKAKIKLLQMLQ